MRILKNILFVTIITLFITSCTDTAEDLVTNEVETTEITTDAARTSDVGGTRTRSR